MTPKNLSPDDVRQQLQWRYATKKFDPNRKIPPAVWAVLEDSLVLSPSSFGLQPWKFFVVQNPELRAQLVAHSWGQTQVVDASHLVVLAIQTDLAPATVDHYLERMATVRQVGTESLQGFGDMVKKIMFQADPPRDLEHWAARQVYIALGFYMTCAAMLGIDTCPMEGINPAQYDAVLGLTEQGYATVVACPAGYRAADDKYAELPKVRFPKAEVVQVID